MSWGQRLQRLAPSTLIRHLRELETLPQLKERNRELGARVKRLTSVQKGSEQAVARLTAEVGRLETRVRQLVAAHETTEKEACDVARITVFSEPDRVLEHVRRAVNEASLDMEPFPHIVVDPVLPDDAYDALVGAVPPPAFFEHLPVNRQELSVPTELAPLRSRRLWGFFASTVVAEALVPVVTRKFLGVLDDYVRRQWPQAADGGLSRSLLIFCERRLAARY
jgi:hypothetical protein